MSESGVIAEYLAALAAQLPAPIVEELADGLDQTRERYLSQGLTLDAADDAAIAEFGEPDVIVAAFTSMRPGRRAARRLLATGPVVGGCWGAALIDSRAWTWHVPIAARFVVGAVLISVIALLAGAAFGKHFRSVGRASAAGCVGMAALDTAILIGVTLVLPAVRWPLIVAMAASAARLTFTARTLRLVLTG